MRVPRPGRPSPALVVSIVALVVAMGGTGYAALNLPRNSVGGKELRGNAVTSPKVKNRSLKAIDFARGQLPRGAQGLQGPKGDPGQNGAAGAPGHDGAPATKLWATVAGDGTLVDGSGVTETGRYSGSTYAVVFDRDVSHCAAVATVGGHRSSAPGSSTGLPTATRAVTETFSTGTSFAAPSGQPYDPARFVSVGVLPYNSTSPYTSSDFHLAVFC